MIGSGEGYDLGPTLRVSLTADELGLQESPLQSSFRFGLETLPPKPPLTDEAARCDARIGFLVSRSRTSCLPICGTY
jgi:hypothetical protein